VKKIEELIRAGNLDEALEAAKNYLQKCEQAYGPESPETARAMVTVAGVCAFRAQMGEAELLINKAREILVKSLGENHPDIAKVDQNLKELDRLKKSRGPG
jgi:hypothetical protein